MSADICRAITAWPLLAASISELRTLPRRRQRRRIRREHLQVVLQSLLIFEVEFVLPPVRKSEQFESLRPIAGSQGEFTLLQERERIHHLWHQVLRSEIRRPSLATVPGQRPVAERSEDMSVCSSKVGQCQIDWYSGCRGSDGLIEHRAALCRGWISPAFCARPCAIRPNRSKADVVFGGDHGSHTRRFRGGPFGIVEITPSEQGLALTDRETLRTDTSNSRNYLCRFPTVRAQRAIALRGPANPHGRHKQCLTFLSLRRC